MPKKPLNCSKHVRLSTPLTSYPFSKDKISKAEAIEVIRAVVYPAIYRKDAVRMIRSRIDYGVKKNLVPRGKVVNSAAFFSWAILQKEWDALAALPGLPRLPSPMMSIGGEISLSAEFFSVSIPSDTEALQEAYRKISLECHKLAKRNRELEIQSQLDQDELMQLRSKYKRRLESCRTNAKKSRQRFH